MGRRIPMQTKRDRIALYCPSMFGGGAERVMLTLAEGFTRKGYPVDLVLAKAEGPYLSQLPAQVRLIDLQASSVAKSLPGLARYVKGEKPRSLLSTLKHANMVALWAKKISAAPVKLTIREANMVTLSAVNAVSLKDRLIPFFMPFFYPWADNIIAVSKGVAEDLAKAARLPRSQIRVIYNPVDLEEIGRQAEEPLEHPWFTEGDTPVILGIGRLSRAKDFSTLLRSFALVRKELSARLVILGEGEERPRLENLIYELGIENDAKLLGYVENPFVYMDRSSVFVLSSLWEGLPNVLIHALALGTPVVATDCPSGPAEILDNGVYGPLVPVGDARAMAQAIISVLGSSREPGVFKKRAAAFSSNRICEKYLEVIL